MNTDSLGLDSKFLGKKLIGQILPNISDAPGALCHICPVHLWLQLLLWTVHISPNGFPPQSPALPFLPQGKASIAQSACTRVQTGCAKWAWRVITTGSYPQLAADKSQLRLLSFRKTILRCILCGFSYGSRWNWAHITTAVTSSVTFFIGFPSFLVSLSLTLARITSHMNYLRPIPCVRLCFWGNTNLDTQYVSDDYSQTSHLWKGRNMAVLSHPRVTQGVRVGWGKQLSEFPWKNGQRCSIHEPNVWLNFCIDVSQSVSWR